jgi:adenosylmethionine-8-amino-7-oxononanoate aminotransferase
MLAMSPPLILTETQADEIVDKIALGLDKLASAFRAEGVWQG